MQEKSFGTISHDESLGYYIVPDGFPDRCVFLDNFQKDQDSLPEGYGLGDRVWFTSTDRYIADELGKL